jgi:AAA15 family ATPase/GTPase
MVILNYIKFSNYKSFKKEELFEIKPLTIVIGKNSSGKSALSRLPLLLSNSFSKDAIQPVSIQIGDTEFGGSFVDLINNRFEHGSIVFELGFENDKSEKFSISFEVQNFFNSPVQVIKWWKLSLGEASFYIDLDLTKYEVHTSKNLTYKHIFGGKEVALNVNFKGVIPVSMTLLDGAEKIPFKIENFDEINRDLNNWAAAINYIGPFRAFPFRVYKHYGTVPQKIGQKGEFAPQILGIDYYFGNQITEKVGQWYKENLGGWKLDINNDINSFEVVLVSPQNPEVKINIVDVGQGMSQVLPLVVRCFNDFEIEPSLDIIEQPELHLHPAAHSALSQLFVETVIKKKSNFIIETHSENIILRIRRLIVEKVISCNDVVIYWVNDEVEESNRLIKITIDEDGEVSEWPEGVFSEDYEEIVAIRKGVRKNH